MLVADAPYDLRAVVTDTTGNVANELLPGLPKTVDNTDLRLGRRLPGAAASRARSPSARTRPTDRRPPRRLGRPLRSQAGRRGAYSAFGAQTAPVIGSTYRQTLATTTLADGLAELRGRHRRRRQRATSAVSTINVDNDAPVVTLDDPVRRSARAST